MRKEDPSERGYCGFARGLGDEYYRQITSEVRVLKRAPTGAVTSAWVPVKGVRNEALDTMNYAEAAARRKGWTSMTESEWDLLDAERGAAPADVQTDLFDLEATSVVAAPADSTAPAEKPVEQAAPTWFGTRKNKGWF